MRTIALLIVLAVALLAYWMPEHAQANAGLPVVNAGWRPPDPDDSRLYANCPITPWALPTHSREHFV